jgi:hypothetical protein
MDRSCWLGTTIALLVALDCLLDCWANDLFYPNVGRNCEGLMGFPWDPHTFDVFYWIVKRFCDGQPFAEVPQRPGRGVRLTAPAGVFLLLNSAESFTTRQEPRSPVGAYMPTSKSAWLLGGSIHSEFHEVSIWRSPRNKSTAKLPRSPRIVSPD